MASASIEGSGVVRLGSSSEIISFSPPRFLRRRAPFRSRHNFLTRPEETNGTCRGAGLRDAPSAAREDAQKSLASGLAHPPPRIPGDAGKKRLPANNRCREWQKHRQLRPQTRPQHAPGSSGSSENKPRGAPLIEAALPSAKGSLDPDIRSPKTRNVLKT